MNIKQWAVFFVAVLSLDYASATFFGGYKGVSKQYDDGGDGYYGWSGGCRCNDDLTLNLDGVLEGLQSKLGKYKKNGIPCKGHSLEEYQFDDGHVQGFQNFQRKSAYRCSLSRDYVRVYFKIGIARLFINYSVSIVEDFLNGFLGGIGSIFGRILGNVTGFFFRIGLPDVGVTIVLNQRFSASAGFEVEGLYLNNIQSLSILDKGLSKHTKKINIVSFTGL